MTRVRAALSFLAVTIPTIVLATGAGYLFVRLIAPVVHSRMFPWVMSRALGIAAYLALTLLVSLGLWLRHPWRMRLPVLHPETRLRVHAALGVAVLVLLAGHVTALALDSYAGVGWKGVFVPQAASYRPTAVSLGLAGMYGLVLVTITAGLAGRLTGRHWLPIHYLAFPSFLSIFVHGLLAGSDAIALRGLYLVTGIAVLILGATRHLVADSTTPARASTTPPLVLR